FFESVQAEPPSNPGRNRQPPGSGQARPQIAADPVPRLFRAMDLRPAPGPGPGIRLRPGPGTSLNKCPCAPKRKTLVFSAAKPGRWFVLNRAKLAAPPASDLLGRPLN